MTSSELERTCVGCGADRSRLWMWVIGEGRPGYCPPGAWGRLLLCVACQVTREYQARDFIKHLVDPQVMVVESFDGLPPEFMCQWKTYHDESSN